MKTGNIGSVNSEKMSVRLRSRAIAVFFALVGAVLLPQIVHALGVLSATGSRLGEILLPMHLPVLLVGLLCGPAVGGIAGLLAPAVSFALTGMPGAAALPYMTVELCVYGLTAGFLSRTKLPSVVSVLAAQVAGRLARLLLLLATGLPAGAILTATLTGWIGILLQLVLLPLILYTVQRHADHV